VTIAKNDLSKSQISDKNIHEESNIYEDEINLIDYFIVLWRRKYFILLAAILPAMIVGISFYLLLGNYKMTYVYDVRGDIDLPNDVSGWEFNEKNYNLLVDSFYSAENLSRLTDGLRKDGFEEYASKISNINNTLSKFIQFEVIPPFLDISKSNITSPEQLKQIRGMKALLLKVTIVGKPKEDMYKISSVIRDNIENVIPLYTVQKQLSSCVINFNNSLADIEKNRFTLELSLQKTNKMLALLKEVSVGIPANKQDNIVLQFNVGEQSQYLPLDYQIQAAESKKIELEENIKANEENYKYYKDLLDLNNKVFAELEKNLSSGDYTIKQFKTSLTALVGDYEKPQLKDYLNSYIRKIENRIAVSKPVTEKPTIYPIARGTVKKSGIVFVIALMLSVFTAFLLEGLKRGQSLAK